MHDQRIDELSALLNFKNQFFLEIHRIETERLRRRDRIELERIRSTPEYLAAFDDPEPLVSVIIPTYNRAQLIIDRALPSLRTQSYKNIEIIIVGDRMADEDAERLSILQEAGLRFYNLKFRGRYPENAGPRWCVAGTKPVNFGLRVARGKWICHLDDDDEFLAGHIEGLLAAARESRAEWAHGVVEFVDGVGRPLCRVGKPQPELGGISRISSLYHAGLKTFRYNPKCWIYSYPGDWDLWERFLQMGVRHAHLSAVVAIHHGAPSRIAELASTEVSFSPDSVNEVKPELGGDEFDAETHACTGGEYRCWAQAQAITPLERRLISREEDPAAGAHTSRFCVIIDARLDSSRLHVTQASLAAQIVAPAVVFVLYEGRNRPLESTEFLQCADLASLGVELAEAWSGEDCWILGLVAGDVLTDDALYLVRRSIGDNRAAVVTYFDHDTDIGDGRHDAPHFKSGPNPDLLRSYPYTGRAVFVRGDWLAEQGVVAPLDIVSSYDLTLRAAEALGEVGLLHVPAMLAHLCATADSVWPRTQEGSDALAAVLRTHLQRVRPGTQLLDGPGLGVFHALPPLLKTPLVTIIIPTKDQLPLLKRCLESLLQKTNYPAFEIIVVDNDSETFEARQYLTGLESVAPDRIRILRHPGSFNFSAMNNRAAKAARGEFLLLLNNDTAAIQADWLSHMMRHALREEVGIVGAALFFPNGQIQHAGVVIGLDGPAGHPFTGLAADQPGYLYRAQVQQNYSAVTGACLLVRKSLYEDIGGLDEKIFAVSYNDIDFCLKVRERGKLVVWTPLAMLLHEGSASQLSDTEKLSQEKRSERFGRERAAMYARWAHVIANDPAYNPNLSLSDGAFTLERNALLRFDRSTALCEHRIAAFLTDRPERGRYRMIQPLEAMKQAGLASGAVLNDLIDVNQVLRSGADTLVFQQPRNERQLLLMEALLEVPDITRIFDGDDFLWNAPFSDIPLDRLPPDFIPRMNSVIRRSNRVVVSNDRLARVLGDMNDNIHVTPDRLDCSMWGDTPPSREAHYATRKPRVGWTADDDCEVYVNLIAEVVRHLAGEIDWVCVGNCPESLRPYVAECIEDVTPANYPSVLIEQDWDLALAPLDNNAFGANCSDVRLLEYGWCGYPVVCSDVPAYRNGLPVRRAANCVADWIAAVRAELRDLAGARARGLALQQCVAAQYVLEGEALQRGYAAWTNPAANGAGAPLQPSAPGRTENEDNESEYAKRVMSLSHPVDLVTDESSATRGRAAMQPGASLAGDEAAIAIIGPSDASYRQWHGQRRVIATDLPHLDRLKQRLWCREPLFHLVVRLDRPQFPLLAMTLESLNGQIYGNWRLDVVSTVDSPGAALNALPNLSWRTVSSAHEAKTAIDMLVSAHACDWIAEMPPGALLDPLCLFRVGHEAATGADGKACTAYFVDDDSYDSSGVRHAPRLKPDFDLDWVRNRDLTGPVFVRSDAWRDAGGASAGTNRPWYDLILRVAERCGPASIGHLAEPLVSLPPHLADDGHAAECRAAVARHLQRVGSVAQIEAVSATVWRLRHQLTAWPSITIAIPSLDRPEMLAPCIDAILGHTLYPDYEILVVDGGSNDADTLALHAALPSRNEAPVRVVRLTTPMNVASFGNLAAREGCGDFLLLLGDDVRVLTTDWLDRLVSHATREGVAAVGPRVVSPPTGLIDQAGYILGIDGLGGTPHRGTAGPDEAGYLDILQVDRTVAALPGACLLVRRGDFLAAGGMDEAQLGAAHADIDFCLRLTAHTGGRCLATAGVTVIKTGGSCLDPVLSWATDTAAYELAKLRAQEILLRRWFDEMSSVRFWSRHLDRSGSTPRIELRCVPTWHALPLDAPRILAFPVQNAQGEIRVVRPLNALRDAGKALPCIFRPTDMKCTLPATYDLARHNPDVIVTHHPIGQSSLVATRQWREFMQDVFIVYALDDLLTDMPLRSSLRQGIPADSRSYLARTLEFCDRLVVSTEFLAASYRDFAKDVRIVPNRLERDIWLPLQTQRCTTARPRIGWAGGTTHEGDLQLIADVIAATAKDVDWIFMGMCPDNIRPHIKEFHAFGDFEQYPARLAALNLDVAVAPLEQIPFNRGKSNLRLLEYGALGIPVVCTDIDPYRDSPACKVANRPQAWLDALRARIHDPDAAQREGEAMREWVLKHYILEDHLDDWLQAHLPG